MSIIRAITLNAKRSMLIGDSLIPGRCAFDIERLDARPDKKTIAVKLSPADRNA
ncbi:MAG: hypothetical protein FD123_2806 [Bacteroidetes bacterium]|nr:MAG: hypothetical protein FD123_2806 [Bacteroidota bacterium]